MSNGDNHMLLSDGCSVRTGQTFKNAIEPEIGGDLSVILPRDIADGSLLPSPVQINSREVGMLNNHLLKNGDIIITNKGVKFGTFLYQGFPQKAIATASFFVITPDQRKVLPDFLNWYLNQPPAREYFFKNAFGSTIQSITKGVLSNLRIPCLPISEQNYLVRFMHEIETEQHLLKGLIQKKEAFGNSYIWEHILKDK
jgi:restriction endonuclease S subunit